MQDRILDNGDGKKAASRLLQLKRDDETDAAFARRLGLESQHIHNYRSGRHGLSLKVVQKITPGLSDAELVFVVAGREMDSQESADAAYARGLREAFAEARAALEAAAGGLPTPSAEGGPLTEEQIEYGSAAVGRQPEERADGPSRKLRKTKGRRKKSQQ